MKNENFRQMIKRHNSEIKNLQKNCKHKRLSKWMDYYWAPAHYGGKIRRCTFCGDILFKKMIVDIELKPITITNAKKWKKAKIKSKVK